MVDFGGVGGVGAVGGVGGVGGVAAMSAQPPQVLHYPVQHFQVQPVRAFLLSCGGIFGILSKAASHKPHKR